MRIRISDRVGFDPKKPEEWCKRIPGQKAAATEQVKVDFTDIGVYAGFIDSLI